MMNFFTNELNNLFGNAETFIKHTFIGHAMVATVGFSHVLAKIEFVATLNATRYNALKVTMIHPENGVLDTVCVKLNEAMGRICQYPGSGELDPCIIYDGSSNTQWNVRPSKEQMKQLSKQVLDYVEMF